ncbi:MAG: hypothetical protein ACKOEE_07820 [Tagaea sp.]
MLKDYAFPARAPHGQTAAANDGGRGYNVRRVVGEDVLRAFPLARLAAGDLSLPAWLGFAHALGAETAGVKKPRRPASGRNAEGLLGVEDARGYLYALCSFAVAPDLRTGRRLCVDNLVAMDLIDGDIPAQALIGALDRLARDLDCPAYVIHLPPAAQAAAAGWRFLSGIAGGGGQMQNCVYRTLQTAD